MVKLNIDTGVEEFEINGGEAAGGGVLRFNPSDPNVYNRFFEARDRLIEMDQESVSASRRCVMRRQAMRIRPRHS